MTVTSRTAVCLSVLAVAVLLVAVSADLAWACDPDPSDWEAGIEACERWQQEMDRAERGPLLATIAGALLALLAAVLTVVRRRR